jgi:hypothetical protein
MENGQTSFPLFIEHTRLTATNALPLGDKSQASPVEQSKLQ